MPNRIPLPDGTPLGDAAFVLGMLQTTPDDFCLFAVARNLTGEGDETGLSLGDLRELVRLARFGSSVLNFVENHADRT